MSQDTKGHISEASKGSQSYWQQTGLPEGGVWSVSPNQSHLQCLSASHRLLCVGIHPLHSYARRVNKHWDTLALGSILIMMKNEDSRMCDSSSLSRDELAEVFTMARWCLTLWERSGDWGQRQLALLCLSAQSGIEGAHCQHSYPICLQLGTSKHSILDKWNKPRCPAPCTEKTRQQSLLGTKRLSINLTPAHSSCFFPNLSPKPLNDTISTWKGGKTVGMFSRVSWFTRDWTSEMRVFCWKQLHGFITPKKNIFSLSMELWRRKH